MKLMYTMNRYTSGGHHLVIFEGFLAKKKKKENLPAIRSSAAEYLTFIATTGDSEQSFEMRYEDENIWHAKNDGDAVRC